MMKIRSVTQFAAMLVAAFVLMSAAGIAQSSKKHPHYPVPTHHNSEFQFDSKKLPRSTPSGPALAGKPAPYAQEVQHLETATRSDLQAAARYETRVPAGKSIVRADTRDHAHSAPINFSFHSNGNGSSVSSRRR